MPPVCPAASTPDEDAAPDFRALVESFPGPVLILTPTFRIVDATDAYLRAAGVARAEIVGCDIFEVFPENAETRSAAATRNLRASLEWVREHRRPDTMAAQRWDLRRPEADGGGFEERWWSPVNWPVLGPDGRVDFIVHQVDDVTSVVRSRAAGRETEARLAREVVTRAGAVAAANRELKETNTTLTRLYERTKALDKLKSEFFANVSHELRTPLALIRGPIDLLLASGSFEGVQREALEVVARNAKILQQEVDMLLEGARFDAGKAKLTYGTVDVAELVRLVGDQFAAFAGERGIDWSVVADGELRAEVDHVQLQRAIANLVSNACKFTPSGGRIRVEVVETDPGWLRIEVADSGPGVPPEAAETVFERFRQLDDDATRRFGGAGLGLPIAADVVKLHGGRIAVDDAPEGGARFTIDLPRQAPPGTAVASASSLDVATSVHTSMPLVPARSRDDPVAETRGKAGAPHVLVIEDNVDMNRLVCDVLATDFRVTPVYDAEAGLLAARDLGPDLVVCDVMLPGGNGDELVAALRRDAPSERVPILLLSARADEAFRVDALRSGADDYVAKPFGVDELRVRVGNLTERKRALDEARQSQARIEGLLEAAPDAMVVVDAHEQIVLANRQASQLVGRPPEALAAAPVDRLGPEVAEVIRAALRGGGTAGSAVTVHRDDGTDVPVDLRLSAVTVNGGSLVTAALRDVTAQREAEARLRADEARAVARASFADSLPSVWDDPSGVLEAVVTQLADVPGGACWVLQLADDGETLVPVAGRHRGADIVGFMRELFAEHPYTIHFGPAGAAFQRNVATLLGEDEVRAMAEEMPARYRDWVRRHPLVSVACVPMRHGDTPSGVLVVHRYAPEPPLTFEDFQFIRSVGGRAALAYENACLHEEAEAGRRTFHSAFHDAPAPVVICAMDEDPPGRFLEVNAAYCELVGYSRDELLTMRVGDLTEPADAGVDDEWMARVLRGETTTEQVDKRLRTADGRDVWVRVRISAVRDTAGRLLHTVNHIEDVTARIEAEERLTRLALHDPVTGMPNRLLLMDRLQHGLDELTRAPGNLALLYVDLDRFKQVNDSFGHAAGDMLLLEIAQRLAGVVRPPDTVARIGGDEFVVLCGDIHTEDEAEHVAERILQALAQPIEVNSHVLAVSASVGISLASDGHEDPHELLREADTAMFRAKQDGRARFQVYRDAFRSDALERLELETDLRRAIAEGRLRVEYQPIIDLRHGGTHGVEALVRFDHPTLGLLGPDQFIPLAEESGLIVPLGRWVLEEACRFQVRLRRAGYDHLKVSVNMSVRELDAPDMATSIAEIIRSTGADPGQLCLEMTESMYMEVARSTVMALGGLTDCGVQVAIDDFGTGYSSLVALRRFPANALKIDRSFVAGLGRSTEDTAIVTGTVQLAHGLDLRVVAEGVETAEQHEAVMRLGSDFAQGYYYAMPLTPDELADYLDEMA